MKAAYYKDLKTLDKPKINLECKLYSLDLSLDSQQYRSAFRLLDYFSTLYFRDKKVSKSYTYFRAVLILVLASKKTDPNC